MIGAKCFHLSSVASYGRRRRSAAAGTSVARTVLSVGSYEKLSERAASRVKACLR